MPLPQKTADSSALFSLSELMLLEEERLRHDEAETRRRIEARDRAAREAAGSREREEQARLRAADEAARAEAQRRREEDARVEAIRASILEQQRAKEQSRAEHEAESRRLEHERQLAQIAQDASARRLRRALVALGLAAAAVVAGGAGLYWGKVKPDMERRADAQASALDDQRAEAKRAKSEADALQKRYDELTRELVAARTPEERAATEGQLAVLRGGRIAGSPPPLGGAGLRQPPPPPLAPLPPAAPCAKGDPMCGLIK